MHQKPCHGKNPESGFKNFNFNITHLNIAMSYVRVGIHTFAARVLIRTGCYERQLCRSLKKCFPSIEDLHEIPL